MNKKTLTTAILLGILLFFALQIELKGNNLNVGLAMGQNFIKGGDSNVSTPFNNIDGSLWVNPMYEYDLFDRFYVRLGYGRNKLDELEYRLYYVSAIYQIINYSSLTLYIGYDISNNYDFSYLYTINGELGIYEEVKKSRKANAFSVGGDIRFYNSYFAFFEYRVPKFKDYDFKRLDFSSYVVGIRYKFDVQKIKTLKNIGET